jgi:hypothetical protein
MKKIITYLGLVLVVAATNLSAQEKQAKDEDKENAVLKKGVLASYGKYYGDTAVNVSGGDKPAGAGEDNSPLQGKIVQKGGGECALTVSNPSKIDTYSASFSVVGTNSKGRQEMKKSYSVSLAPGKSTERLFTCKSDLNIQAVLTSGKRTHRIEEKKVEKKSDTPKK